MRKSLLCLLLMLPLAAHAAWKPSVPAYTTIKVSQNGSINLEDAATQVQREHGGRILSAETVSENGRQIHVIKVLTPDNSVRTLHIPVNGN